MKHPLNFLVATALLCASFTANASDDNSTKLYALDCGAIEMFDISRFSSEGHFDGQSATLSVPCFLIRHPKGDLLWDTGIDQSLADMPDGLTAPWGKSTMKRKLTDQLADLGLTPADIEYLAISHWHPDHSGNAALFATSTLVTSEAEHAFMFSDTMKADAEGFKIFAPLETAPTIKFTEEHDVFGDGTVVVKSMPGHTLGHSVLMVRLANAGTILLTGDLYTHSEGRTLKAVPVFNADKEATRTSHQRFEALAKSENARVVVQHEKTHFEALPKFPAYLN